MVQTRRGDFSRLRVVAGLVGLIIGLVIVPEAVVAESPEEAIRTNDDAGAVFETGPPDRPSVGPYLTQFKAEGTARVEIVLAPDAGAAIRNEVKFLGGRVLGAAPGVLLVEVPSDRLATLERRVGVELIRAPVRVDLLPGPIGSSALPLGVGGDHVTATNAAAWQSAGYLGAGVKVGVIDYFSGGVWSAAQSTGDVPAAAGTFCLFEGVTCDIWGAGSPHGVAVAEVVYDMAPAATLYLATAVTSTDLQAAVAWLDSQGVKIITRSLGSQFDGAGDGTGTLDAIVDDAVSRGMTFFNAAGNHASASGAANGGYWRGSFVDDDADGWLEFAPGDETLGFVCGQIQGFRWSDWGPNPSDYDIYITDALGNLLAFSQTDQSSGAPPVEIIDLDAIDCAVYPVVYLFVYRFANGNGTAGDVLEFMVNATAFEYSSNPYSASGPVVDAANPGMMTVGAIDPANGTIIAAYSSQGPTNDGRIKPDIAAPSCLPSVSYSPSCFNGTSAATPVAAGAAALLLEAGAATTPTETTEYLRSHAIDRGAPGTDPIYGAGQLYLGAPPSDPAISIGDVTVSEGATAQFSVSLSETSTEVVTVDFATVNASAEAPGDYTALSGTVTFVSGDVLETVNVPTTDDDTFESTETFFVDLSNPVNALIADGRGRGTLLDVNSAPVHTTALVDPNSGEWHLYNSFGTEMTTFYFGNPGDFPIMGDWDGDGIETPGMYRQSDGFVYLRNSNAQGIADIRFFFGDPGDVPIAGDFDGDGADTVSIWRPSEARIYIINELGKNNGGLGAADFTYLFGNPGDKPFVGDFDRDGVETIGLHRESTGLVYFRNSQTTGIAENSFIYGDPGDRLVAGDWIGDGTFTPALFRPATTTIYFRYTNTAGNANYLFANGQSAWLPVSGYTGV